MPADVVILDGGHGDAHAPVALRQNKFEGSIMLIGRAPGSARLADSSVQLRELAGTPLVETVRT